MPVRISAPLNLKGKDGLPLMVLPEGTVLKETYRASFLGVGGMSISYRGEDGGAPVFIKEVEGSQPQRIVSLVQEKALMEQLSHPGIVRVRDFFEENGYFYLITDFIEGKSLEKSISPIEGVFLQEKVVSQWAFQLYDIFEYLHSQSPPLIYRDLKPHNVVRDAMGRLYLVDFGIARLFKSGKNSDTEPMGSFVTASPEHYGGGQTDERSDIFTLGATIHFLLANGKGRGIDPFDFAPLRSVNPRVSEQMERLVQKALELDREKRFSSVREMRDTHRGMMEQRENVFPVSTGPVMSPDSAVKDAARLDSLMVWKPEKVMGKALLCLLSVALVVLCALHVLPGGKSEGRGQPIAVNQGVESISPAILMVENSPDSPGIPSPGEPGAAQPLIPVAMPTMAHATGTPEMTAHMVSPPSTPASPLSRKTLLAPSLPGEQVYTARQSPRAQGGSHSATRVPGGSVPPPVALPNPRVRAAPEQGSSAPITLSLKPEGTMKECPDGSYHLDFPCFAFEVHVPAGYRPYEMKEGTVTYERWEFRNGTMEITIGAWQRGNRETIEENMRDVERNGFTPSRLQTGRLRDGTRAEFDFDDRGMGRNSGGRRMLVYDRDGYKRLQLTVRALDFNPDWIKRDFHLLTGSLRVKEDFDAPGVGKMFELKGWKGYPDAIRP